MNQPDTFKESLRDWRKQRRMSQLDLALIADVSQRHISWLETGKSRPSRDMVIKLCDAMDVPLRDRNPLLNNAGFASLYSHKALDEPSMVPITKLLQTILTHHDPLPAYVIDRYWNIKMQNNASKTMFEVAGDPNLLWNAVGDNGQRNIALLTVHPNGLRNIIQNWADIAGPFMLRLKNEMLDSDDPLLQQRYEQLENYCSDTDLMATHVDEHVLPVLPIRFEMGEKILSLYSVISTLGTAQDITANELRIETFYPCDTLTENFFTQ